MVPRLLTSELQAQRQIPLGPMERFVLLLLARRCIASDSSSRHHLQRHVEDLVEEDVNNSHYLDYAVPPFNPSLNNNQGLSDSQYWHLGNEGDFLGRGPDPNCDFSTFENAADSHRHFASLRDISQIRNDNLIPLPSQLYHTEEHYPDASEVFLIPPGGVNFAQQTPQDWPLDYDRGSSLSQDATRGADHVQDMINELLNQPGDVRFDMSSEQGLTAEQATSSRVTSSETREWPPFPSSKWQHKMLKSEVAMIHNRITSPWPKNITTEESKVHLRRINSCLEVHPEIIASMMKGDEKTWQTVIFRSMPNVQNTRPKLQARSSNRIYMVEPAWLARPILSSKRKYIIQRLANHWNGTKEARVNSRLIIYARKFGKISSPEPLFEDDQERFRIAADAIFCEGAPHGDRNVGASDQDLLHQYSVQYSVPVEGEEGRAAHVMKEPSRFKSDAARFRTGQGWMDMITLEEVDRLHKMIIAHWKDTIDPRVLSTALQEVNEILERDEVLLDRLKRGDRSAAYMIAKRCIKPMYMKDPS